MTIKALYKKLNAISNNLKGELTFEDDCVKWFYDGLSTDIDCSMDEHLIDVVQEDRETILELLEELDVIDDFRITDPDYDETYATFYIAE